MAMLLEAGYKGWWELEVLSDDGLFGTVLPDSYWSMAPEDFLRQAKDAFDRSYSLAVQRLVAAANPTAIE